MSNINQGPGFPETPQPGQPEGYQNQNPSEVTPVDINQPPVEEETSATPIIEESKPISPQEGGEEVLRVEETTQHTEFSEEDPDILRLLNMVTYIEEKFAELKTEIDQLSTKQESLPEEQILEEDPRKVVQKLTQDLSNDQSLPNLEEGFDIGEVYDSYKQQLDNNPYAPLPQELSTQGEYDVRITNLADFLPTSVEPRIEINQQTQQKEIVLPFPANTSTDPEFSASFEGQFSHNYDAFVEALRQSIQPPSEGVYIKLTNDRNETEIVRISDYHFDRINNLILQEEEKKRIENSVAPTQPQSPQAADFTRNDNPPTPKPTTTTTTNTPPPPYF
jgi:hypothetical protein